MAQLKSSRTSDSTYIGQTDDWDAELEADIAEILGVGIDHTISSPIFAAQTNVDGGSSGSGTGQVNTDGTISGILQFLSTSTSKSLAAGVEFETTSGNRYKIAGTADNLEIMEWNSSTETWDLITNLNEVGTFLGLGDTPSSFGTEGQVPAVNAAGDALEFVDVATGSVALLSDIGDVPAYSEGNYMKISGGSPTWAAGSGVGATTFDELSDTAFDPTDSDNQRLRAEVYNNGSGYKLRGVPTFFSWGAHQGLNDSAGLTNPSTTMNIASHFRYMYFQVGNPSSNTGDVTVEVHDPVLGAYTHRDDVKIPRYMSGLWMFELELNVDIFADNTIWVEVEEISNVTIPHKNITVSPPMQAWYDYNTQEWKWRNANQDGTTSIVKQFIVMKFTDTADGYFRIRIKMAQGGLSPGHMASFNLLGRRLG